MVFRVPQLLSEIPLPLLTQHLDCRLAFPVFGDDPAGLIERLVGRLHLQAGLSDDHRNFAPGLDVVLLAPFHWKSDSPLVIDLTGELLHNTDQLIV
jgi:hypothetical protein